MRIDINIEAKRLKELVGDLADRAKNLRPAYHQCGRYVATSITQNFDEEGRPEKWEPLQQGSLESLARNIGRGGHRVKTKSGAYTKHATRIIGGHKILNDKGTLRSSITTHVTNHEALVGPGILPYARIHQKGYDGINKAGRYQYMPARPYCLLQDGDGERCAEIIGDYILKGEL